MSKPPELNHEGPPATLHAAELAHLHFRPGYAIQRDLSRRPVRTPASIRAGKRINWLTANHDAMAKAICA